MKFRIFADFNRITKDEKGDRIYIGKERSRQLEMIPFITGLKEGYQIYLYDGEIIVETIVEFDNENQAWYGRPDWSTFRELSSRADGIDEYKNALPEQRLAILRYETINILSGIQGCVEILENREQIITGKHPEIYERLISDLSGFLKDLMIIIEKLTE
jgi:hypothetical protein